MSRLLKLLVPPKGWKMVAAIIAGSMIGISMYAFYTSNAISYLSDDPATCVNCHIMAPEFSTWQHSSHRERAVCNDCHVPHNNALNKWYFKAKDGLRHATIFTARMEPQTIFIKEAGIEVVQDNCVRCHFELITEAKLLVQTNVFHNKFKDRLCWECHREVPHGRVNSLSSVPFARGVPVPKSPVPEWLKNIQINN